MLENVLKSNLLETGINQDKDTHEIDLKKDSKECMVVMTEKEGDKDNDKIDTLRDIKEKGLEAHQVKGTIGEDTKEGLDRTVMTVEGIIGTIVKEIIGTIAKGIIGMTTKGIIGMIVKGTIEIEGIAHLNMVMVATDKTEGIEVAQDHVHDLVDDD